MKKTPNTRITNTLNVDFSQENSLWLTDGKTLRKLIGILGMALPLLLLLFLYIASGLNHPLESISHYYYTRVSSIFVGILSILGIFLIIYKGKEPIDFFISLAAGIFVLCVVCFPTSNITDICCDAGKPFSVTKLNSSPIRENFHYISAAIFLSCLTYMSLFLFTKSDKAASERGSKKKTRNRIYRICGVLMLIAILVILAGFLKLIPEPFYKDHCLTFWMETLAVESFGFSWLIKGEAMFGDV
jgi:hypothetical protein